jgi:type IV pilus assembly protein PilM
MGLFVKETEFFGLDIGSTAIRLVQLRRGGGHPALVAYGALPVPANLTSSDSQMDQDKIAELVRQLVRENRVALKNVVVGLSATKVFATVITTPKLDNAQLAKAIRYQAEQYIPMALDQVKLDWAVIDQSKDGKQLEVLLVAAPTAAIDKYVSIIEKAGLEAIKPTLDNLVSEVEKSTKYFMGRYPDVKLEKLIVTGAASGLPELGPFLANSTGLPVEFGNAWVNVSYPSSLQDKLMGLSVEYAAAVGLAGRGYM